MAIASSEWLPPNHLGWMYTHISYIYIYKYSSIFIHHYNLQNITPFQSDSFLQIFKYIYTYSNQTTEYQLQIFEYIHHYNLDSFFGTVPIWPAPCGESRRRIWNSCWPRRINIVAFQKSTSIGNPWENHGKILVYWCLMVNVILWDLFQLVPNC